ncbi:MAG: FtsH protease activity modulator HflK, partial [Gammaproteobacteria bacterium]
WHIPWPVEREEIVQFDRVSSVQHKATMLTEDENIVDVELAVQYLVNDAPNFLFNVRDDLAERNPEQRADQSVVQALESAVREVVGKSKMDFILGEGRAEIAANTKTRMQEMLDDYGRGVVVTTVNMQQAQPPEQVQAAFDDAIKAREDQVRFRNKAEAYSNDIIPQARGRAARLEQESNAYRDRVIARSEGEAARFEKLLAEYEKAPGVTRERLYLDAVESVLSKSSKVMLDVEGGNNLLYLPLDRLIQEGGSRRAAAPGLDDSLDLSGVLDNQSGQSSRGREVR